MSIKLPSNYDSWKTQEPNDKEYIKDHDWTGHPIWNYEAEQYFKTDDGWVLKEEEQMTLYMRHVWGQEEYPDDF